jgi:hypothetical protein
MHDPMACWGVSFGLGSLKKQGLRRPDLQIIQRGIWKLDNVSAEHASLIINARSYISEPAVKL